MADSTDKQEPEVYRVAIERMFGDRNVRLMYCEPSEADYYAALYRPCSLIFLIRQSDHERIVGREGAQIARLKKLAQERLDMATDDRKKYLDARDALEKERQDAARYRWLRDSDSANWRPFCIRHAGSAEDADRCVDAAMSIDSGEHFVDVNKMV